MAMIQITIILYFHMNHNNYYGTKNIIADDACSLHVLLRQLHSHPISDSQTLGPCSTWGILYATEVNLTSLPLYCSYSTTVLRSYQAILEVTIRSVEYLGYYWS